VTVGRLPPRNAVSVALREVPGMRKIEHREVHPPTAFSLYKGVIHESAFDQFVYQGASASGVIELHEREGEKTLRLYSYSYMGPKTTKETFDAARSLMDIVYYHLRLHAPGLPPADEVKEELIRPPR
jgi:hypothetical protein